MAADDAGERTEQPTPRRLKEARDAGRVPRSQDLTATVAVVGGLLLLKLLGGRMLAAMLDMLHAIGNQPDVTGRSLPTWVGSIANAALRMTFPFLALLVILTVIGVAAQSGLLISVKLLKPKFDKLNPINGFKRLFSLDSVTRVGMGVLKMAFIALVAYFSLVGDIGTVLSAGTISPLRAFQMSGDVLYHAALRMGLALLVLALLDYAYQRWNWWRNLKMTKQQVRDELKNMEGDPKVRQRRRQMQFNLAMQRIGLDVPKSDVVVTNPTEYAVALRYDQAAMAAPRVTAKGKDLLAARIRQLAQQHGIPVVQRPPLARALYAAVNVGREVPPAFYRAVAEVLAYVYQLTGRAAPAVAHN